MCFEPLSQVPTYLRLKIFNSDNKLSQPPVFLVKLESKSGIAMF